MTSMREMFFTLNKEGRQTSTSIIGKGRSQAKYITGKGQTNIIAATKVTDWYSTQTKYIMALLLSPTWNNTQKQKKQFIISKRFFNIFSKIPNFASRCQNDRIWLYPR